MSYKDHAISPSRVRLRRSLVAGDTPSQGELRPGELAVNSEDATLYVGQLDGTPRQVGVASTTVTAIVALTASQYEDLDPPGATTLYIITNASPESFNLYLGDRPLCVEP
jgi:hypothetical protein